MITYIKVGWTNSSVDMVEYEELMLLRLSYCVEYTSTSEYRPVERESVVLTMFTII